MRAVFPVLTGAVLFASQAALAAGDAPPDPTEAEMRAKLDAALAALSLTPLGELQDKASINPQGAGPESLPVVRSGTPDLTEVLKRDDAETDLDMSAQDAPDIDRPAGSYAIAEDPKRYANVRNAVPATIRTASPDEDSPETGPEAGLETAVAQSVAVSAPAKPDPQGELRIRASDGMHNSLAALRQRTLANPIAYPLPIAQAPRSAHGPIVKEGTYLPPSEYADIARMAARMHAVPEDLFFKLVKAESNWNPEAVSRVGALGLAQLMPGTAKLLGVDPLDPFQNLEGGARYLAQQFDRFGSWDLALAAYNAGPGAVEQYGGIPPYPETQSYVRKILGIELAQSNAQ